MRSTKCLYTPLKTVNTLCIVKCQTSLVWALRLFPVGTLADRGPGPQCPSFNSPPAVRTQVSALHLANVGIEPQRLIFKFCTNILKSLLSHHEVVETKILNHYKILENIFSAWDNDSHPLINSTFGSLLVTLWSSYINRLIYVNYN